MQVTPLKNSSLTKKQQVAAMFNNIALRYDFLNHFLSLGIDHYWRRKVISLVKNHLRLSDYKSEPVLLDAATGTADVAIAASRLKLGKVFGVDISPDMLAIGRNKIKKKKLTDVIELLEGDSENLIF